MERAAPRPARVSPWSFKASAEASVTYSDNATLAPSAQARSDVILGLRLPMSASHIGPRLKLELNYAPAYYLYTSGRQSDEWQNYLRGALAAELVTDRAYLDAAATVDQTYASPFSARPDSGTGITNNRTEQRAVRLSPYLRNTSASGWQYIARDDAAFNTYTDAALDDSLANRLQLAVRSPSARLREQLDYTYLYTKFSSRPEGDYQQIARLRPMLAVTPQLNVAGRLGYETNNYEAVENSGPVYGGQVDWMPSGRTRLEGFVEHRFFGTSYGLNLTSRSRRTVWRVEAGRGVVAPGYQTFGGSASAVRLLLDDPFRPGASDPPSRTAPEAPIRATGPAPDPFVAQAGLAPVLANPTTVYANQVYVSRQLGGSIALVGHRNVLEAGVFWEENEALGSGSSDLVFSGTNQFRQTGARLTFSHQLSPYSSIGMTATRLDATPLGRYTPSSVLQKSTQDTLNLSLTRRLGTKSSVSVGLRWTDFDAQVSPYRETAVFAAIAHSL
jgi:uncharacterized protein (PEP-CTERM system associated)